MGLTVYKYGLGMSTACFLCNQTDIWQQFICHTQPTSGHKKVEKLGMIQKLQFQKRE